MTDQIERGDGARPRGSDALYDAIHLQEAVRERVTDPESRRGRRRKGDVVDLDTMTVTRSRGRRWLMVLLTTEAVIAVIAVAVLVTYLVAEGEKLQ